MSGTRWHLLTTVPNAPCAHALVQSLRARGIDSKVVSDSTLLGEARACRIMVEEPLAARAHRMLEDGQFTDEELTFLATGEVSCDDAKE